VTDVNEKIANSKRVFLIVNEGLQSLPKSVVLSDLKKANEIICDTFVSLIKKNAALQAELDYERSKNNGTSSGM